MQTLTIFTPTYNRAYCLPRVYQSLVSQTCMDFEWLVIDDGSTDNTRELVHQWMQENKLSIRYIYQENQGMHGGYNTAYANTFTELVVALDSDDYFTPDAVEVVLDFWKKHGSEKYAGIIALDGLENGKVLGNYFPEELIESTLEDVYHKYKVKGDKKLFYRTEVVKQYPKYPLFKGESFVPLGILYLMIDKDYPMLCLNKIVCIVEYMDDGSSKNIYRQYFRHPNGFRYSRLIEMKYSKYTSKKIMSCIHFIAHSIKAKNFKFLCAENPQKLLTIVLFPIGVLLYLYTYYRVHVSKTTRKIHV